MAYIIGLGVVALFFGVMHFFTAMSVKQKVTATVVVLSFVMGALFYNNLQNENHMKEKLNNLLSNFENARGKFYRYKEKKTQKIFSKNQSYNTLLMRLLKVNYLKR